ncbi:MAG: 6-phosphofructokinase [Bacteroidales bacterium]|nr:6-phosphofructokinase [Bacteroidales bacterium]MDD4029894.1 6-phosphofructokinase [Bacteroidales bacterium]MDD4434974.1 6-phosphofructokinase [Bacteroidales bacterium]MDD5732963.1 6-phosphofructokinase [Bacteroidales bacterium]
MKTIKTIGVLTSGGDAPGMNAAIRAVVRTSIYHGCRVIGIQRGFTGLLQNLFIPLQNHSVAKKISLGGTFLKSSRCPEFKTREARSAAWQNIQQQEIDALVVIGGDGSFRAADLLVKEFGLPVIGIPGTIDNDIFGTDYTIGFDTAVNTAVQAVDKLRDTADSHNMVFFVEVMGRDAGFIALNTSISTGAEATLIPEVQTDIDTLCEYLEQKRRKNKTSGIIIVAEGHEQGSASTVAAKVKERLPGYETRVTTLGHVQRGGAPTANDRILASILGHDAAVALLEGKTGMMAGQVNNQTVFTPFHEACARHSEINKRWVDIAYILSL